MSTINHQRFFHHNNNHHHYQNYYIIKKKNNNYEIKNNQQGSSSKTTTTLLSLMIKQCYHYQHHRQLSITSILMFFIIHLFIICMNLHSNNNVDAFDYWRKLGPLSGDLKLGNECYNSLECLLFVPHSQCDCNTKICTCQPYHILYNQTMCLPASLLGYACIADEQCTTRVPNSECKNGLCKCKSNYLSLRRDKCLPPAMANDYCLNEQQCLMGNKYSKCKYIIPKIYGKCRCLDGFHQTMDNRCLPNLHSTCNNSIECQQVTPNSYCFKSIFNNNNNNNSYNKCQCKPGFKESNLTCRPFVTTTTTTTTTTEPTKQVISNIIDDEEISIEDEFKIHDANSLSLGQSCNHTFECQLRDPYTRCVNGVCDCIKYSDNCNLNNIGCYNDTFQCRNGQCISWYFVCDNNKQCDDGSDESSCIPYHCPKEAFQCKSDGICVPRQSVCNGKLECIDGSDEEFCNLNNDNNKECDSKSWQCKSGQCVPQYAFCNTVLDCDDGSDEDEEICENAGTCPLGTFTCSNQMCRSTAILCSGVDGCGGDNSDEDRCEVCYCQKP